MRQNNLSKNPMLSPFEINDNLITFEKKEFEAIINSVPDGILIADSKGWVLFVNKSFETITGVKSADILGRNVSANVKSGLYSYSVVSDILLCKDKMTKMVDFRGKEVMVTGIPIMKGEGILDKVVCTVKDLTELNMLKENLEKSVSLNINYERQLHELKSTAQITAKLIGSSSAMESVIYSIKKVANLDVTVLITGESGTGKGVVAELIHKLSRRNEKGGFIHINCGAIPETLIESELFGYEKGAFTGANKEGKPGLIELAHNGTLFLDEIGEMPMNLQVKLLHVIQNKEVMRVGGTKSYYPNVRFIAAYHQNLEELCKKNLFRYDLYYRLNVVPIQIPPLRERKTDITTLANYFMRSFNQKYGFNKTFSPEVMDDLENYYWPGNVRELENIIERLLIMSPGKIVTRDDLPGKIKGLNSASYHAGNIRVTLKELLVNTEEQAIKRAIDDTETLMEAAESLGIDLSTLTRKKQKYNIYKREKDNMDMCKAAQYDVQ